MNTESFPKTKIEMHELKQVCSNCHVREICMPIGAPPELLRKLDELLLLRRRLKSGTVLYHAGGHFHAFYAVKSGFIKTETLSEQGHSHVTGFYMMGEIFGFDGVATNQYMCTATALEDTEVCIIPLDRIEHVGHEFDQLQHHFYKLMSREIVRDHTIIMVLGSMNGEERLSAFLLNLSQRLH